SAKPGESTRVARVRRGPGGAAAAWQRPNAEPRGLRKAGGAARPCHRSCRVGIAERRTKGEDSRRMSDRVPYVELRCRSAFSFLEGASTPEDLAEVAARYGCEALALADRDGLYGAPRFWK